MDIRARTLLAFTPLLALLAGLAIVLPLIEWRDQQLLAAQIAAADDLIDTQTIGLNLLQEHVAVGQIARAQISPRSERYTAAHAEITRLLTAHASFPHATQELDMRAAERYAELGQHYAEIVAFAQTGNLVTALQLYGAPRTLQLLDGLLAINAQTRDAAREEIITASRQAETAQRHAFRAITAALVLGLLITLGLSWALISQLVRPIERLATDAEHYASGEISGQLSPVSNIGQLRRLREAFQRLLDANTARQQRIQQNLDELNQRIAREQHLRATVQALSVPVVPLQENMLLLPLIGHLDDRRAAELTDGLLDAIYRTRARAVVLDITGLADLDAAGTRALTHAVDAARLLGCRIFLVGVRASQAIALTESDLVLGDLTIARDIPSVLAMARSMV